jgi:protein phosphatase
MTGVNGTGTGPTGGAGASADGAAALTTGAGIGGSRGSLLTIGAFARATRLTPKALRLYDAEGLLRPAVTDPVTGYRRYAPEQLERARLVAWLRRIGMPLAEIHGVCALPPARAADAVRVYWERVEADTAARRDLVALLAAQLSEEDAMHTGTGTPFTVRCAARSETGLVRTANQDAAHADARLLAVADGYGRAGAEAGAAAIGALAALAARQAEAGDLLSALHDALAAADRTVDALGAAAGADGVAEGAGAGDPGGTTLTALLPTGSRLALVHIGDSRAYLLRDGGLFQITDDHTWVRSLVAEGRLTPEEAASHPQRALLLRSLDGQGESREAEVTLRDAVPGDRYLLCSDGLSAVVPGGELRETLAAAADPEEAVRALVDAALAAGGPDNVTCVVADILPGGAEATGERTAGERAAGTRAGTGSGTLPGGG